MLCGLILDRSLNFIPDPFFSLGMSMHKYKLFCDLLLAMLCGLILDILCLYTMSLVPDPPLVWE